MKRLLIVSLTVALVAVLPVAAQERPELPPKALELVRSAEAPMIQVLAKSMPETHMAYGWEEEVPIRLPDWLLSIEKQMSPPDPISRAPIPQKAPAFSLSFDGYSNNDNLAVAGGFIAPPDTEGDVGLDYYVQWNNLGWYIYDKTNPANSQGPFAGNVFWQVPAFNGSPCQSDNAGDPIVLFDHIAQQWMFSQFTSPSNPDGHQCFAISTGSNPAGPYNLYDFLVSPGAFNDYPKIGLWTDASGTQSSYVMTTNEFGASFLGVNVTAFERDAMLTGGSPAAVQVTLPYTGFAPVRFSLQSSHLEGPNLPASGTCPFVIQSFDDETWGNGGANGPDGYQLWNYCLDWTNPTASVLTQGPFLTSPNFNAGLTQAPQPGAGSLDTLGQFTMYRFHNRADGSGQVSGAVSHTIDLGGGLNGIRWTTFALPSLGGSSITDTGSLNVGDGLHRWMPSVALDGAGNLGMVFTRSGSSAPNYPSVYFTGRETTDPAGTLQSESVCVNGTGSQLGTDRWGDYASVSVDPDDDCTFWVTNEYVATTGNFSWNTRICTFKFPSCGGGGGCTAGSVTLNSIAAHDGWTRERGETSNVGQRSNSTGAGNQAIRVGDHQGDQQYKAIVSFDTAGAVPAGCSISSATLQLTRGNIKGTNPFSTFQPLWVDVSDGGFGGNVALAPADFQAAATATQVTSMSSPPSNGSLSTGNLNAAGIAAITGGVTQFRLYFQLDDNDNLTRDTLGFRPGENTNTPPQLVINYQ